VKDPLADLPAILQQKNQSVKFDVARIDLEELYRVLCRNRDKNPEDCYEELAKGCSLPALSHITYATSVLGEEDGY
jgi:hypothetical protein